MKGQLNRQNLYFVLLLLAAASVTVLCVQQMVMPSFAWGFLFPDRKDSMIFLFFLLLFCRAFPLNLDDERSIDLGFGPAAAGFFLVGFYPTIVSFALSVFVLTEKRRLLLFAEPKKQLSALANSLLAIWIAGVVLHLFGGVVADFSTADLLVHISAFLLIACIAETLLQLLQRISQTFRPTLAVFRHCLVNLLQKMAVSLVLGGIFAILLREERGVFYGLLFLIPAVVARYMHQLCMESRFMHLRTMAVLSRAIEVNDPYIKGHSQRVAFLAGEIARHMHLGVKEIEDVEVAALLHDIGRIGIDVKIWNKPGLLTEEEFEEIKKHPLIGRQMIEHIGFSKKVCEAIEYHHCYYDGSGYPSQVRAGAVPIAASIIGIADAYDAMTSDRPYRRRLKDETALRLLRENSGKQFEPRIVEAFVAILTAQFEAEAEAKAKALEEETAAKGQTAAGAVKEINKKGKR